MTQPTINMNVPDDCLTLLKSGLEKSNKAGTLSLEEAFYMYLAIKNIKTHLDKCKDHVCLPPLVEVAPVVEEPECKN